MGFKYLQNALQITDPACCCVLLVGHLDPVLPGVDAGGHSEGGVGHAGHHGNHRWRVF